MSKDAYFTPEFFRFLNELKAHNERDWFLENKTRYQEHVKAPFLQLVSDLGPRLAKVSRYLVADPRPVGGSMMRINRDIRFSKDKSPYKTSVAGTFWHSKGQDEAMPAFYLHLAPGDSGVGAGIWRPEPKALKLIRDAMVDDSKAWQKATAGLGGKSPCGMMGESLKRPPPGYDPNHALIEDLKRKDFALSVPLKDKDVTGSGLIDRLDQAFKACTPFLRFLSEALELPF